MTLPVAVRPNSSCHRGNHFEFGYLDGDIPRINGEVETGVAASVTLVLSVKVFVLYL